MILVGSVLVGVVVGVIVKARGQANSTQSHLTSTDSPSASPTAGLHEGCQEYSHVAHYSDPETASMTIEGQKLYKELFLVDNSILSSKNYQCSAPNVAAKWVATTFCGQNATNQTISNQFALATVYFHWKGQGIVWLKSPKECTWIGVVCSGTGVIADIGYTGSGPQGDSMTLSTEIGLMTDLSKSQHGLSFCWTASVPP
jgi:hypothetical protein